MKKTSVHSVALSSDAFLKIRRLSLKEAQDTRGNPPFVLSRGILLLKYLVPETRGSVIVKANQHPVLQQGCEERREGLLRGEGTGQLCGASVPHASRALSLTSVHPAHGRCAPFRLWAKLLLRGYPSKQANARCWVAGHLQPLSCLVTT